MGDTFDYAALRDDDVTPLIVEFGVAGTLTRWTKGAYDRAAGSYAAGSSADLAVTVVISDFAKHEIDGTLIRRTDKRVIMSGAEDAPLMNDKLVVAGVEYEVIRIEEIKPGNVVVAYEMQVRA